MLDRVIAGRDPFAKDPPARKPTKPKKPKPTKPSRSSKPSITKGPPIQTRLLPSYLTLQAQRGNTTASRPAKEIESPTWWKTQQRRCLWQTRRWKRDGKAAMTIFAVNPKDESFWAIDVPDELLQSVTSPPPPRVKGRISYPIHPAPKAIIADDAIYLVGPESCAWWRPGSPPRALDIPGRGKVELVDGKFYVLFEHTSGTGRFGLGGEPTHASGVYEYDPTAKKVTLLVASRRIPGKTVLDNCLPYHPKALFLDSKNRLNLVVRSWDTQTDTIYRQDKQWKWTPVHVRSRTELMVLEYDRIDGRTFVHGRHTCTGYEYYEEWGVMPGANAPVECVWRHPRLDPAKGLAPGTPRDKCPPGPFVRRDGKRYYLGGRRGHFKLIKPELLIYDEKTGLTSSRPLLVNMPEWCIKRYPKKQDPEEAPNARRMIQVESGLIFADGGFAKRDLIGMFWFVPWTAIDHSDRLEPRADSP